MSHLSFAFTLFLLANPLLVAAQDGAPPAAPAETVSLVWVFAFGVLFVGTIVWFFLYLMYKERRNKQNNPGN